MNLSFGQGYRAVAWIHARYKKASQRDNFAAIIYPYFKKAKINAYIGVSFGKFSRVIDFHSKSSRDASLHFKQIQKSVEESHFDCSFSISYFKPFEHQIKNNNLHDTVSAYTFFRPQKKIPYETFLEYCQNLEQQTKTSIQAYWNNSMYPLMVIIRGSNYNDVANLIRTIRANSGWAVDSTSYFALKINPNTMVPQEDEPKGKVDAIIFGKLVSLQRIDKGKLRIGKVDNIFTDPFERYGWYDFCDALSFPNLYELYKYSRKLKEKSQSKVSFISSILLKELMSYA